jgi:hypothetical protein
MSTKSLVTEVKSHHYGSNGSSGSLQGGNAQVQLPASSPIDAQTISRDMDSLIAQLKKADENITQLGKMTQSKIDLLKVGNGDIAKMNM